MLDGDGVRVQRWEMVDEPVQHALNPTQCMPQGTTDPQVVPDRLAQLMAHDSALLLGHGRARMASRAWPVLAYTLVVVGLARRNNCATSSRLAP